MKRLLAVLALAGLAACSRAPEAPAPTITLDACRLPGVDSAVRCGTYEVWEDREAKSGRRIVLDLAIIPAKLRAKEPDPIVILAGGPGQGAMSLAAQLLPIFSRMNDSRDILLLDQRGTGNSNPLDCDEEQEQPLQALFEDTLPEPLVARCLARLDADPRLYTTSIAVEDLDEVRAALGYGKLNLWGASYGTRFALEYVRRHGDRVRSMVIDGVAPADMKLPLSFVDDGDAAFKRLLEACEGEALCARSYPNLAQMVAEIRAQLARRPARVGIQDPRTGERQSINVSENVFLSGLFRPLYLAELASLLPYGISAAAAGDFNPLLAQNLEFADDVAENLSLGMHLSVVCSEDIPRITPADVARLSQSFFGRALVDDFLRACNVWPRGKVPADYYEPVRSDVPTLILSGGIDPATPPRYGEQVAKTLTRSKHLVAPYLGHGVTPHGCAPRLLESFVKSADPATIDGKCLQSMPRPLFVLPVGTRR
jgi:pimeloyl-ACP methyl ester carboxylesterase